MASTTSSVGSCMPSQQGESPKSSSTSVIFAPLANNYYTHSLFLGIFLINFEVTIVSTAIVSITNDLNDFAESSWIITAYLITYIGKKPTRPLTHIILRGFFNSSITTSWSGDLGKVERFAGAQVNMCHGDFHLHSLLGGMRSSPDNGSAGIGGSGMYAISMVMIYELVPPPKYPLYTASAIALVALANAIGPVFGGLITERATWRWVFLLNTPTGVVSGTLLLLAVPADFPNQGRTEPRKQPSFKEVDFIGALLMLSALALVITGLERAASLLTWTTADALGPLCASALALIAFLACQYWHASRPRSLIEPVFPWRFCQNRVVMGLILASFMSGAVSITFVFQLPLRYQTAAGSSPLQAGLKLLPFSLSGPVGSIVAAGLSKKLRVPPIFLMLLGSIMQIIGIVFASRGPPRNPNWSGLYGLEVVVGLGFGFCLGAATLVTPFIFEKRDLAVGTAATVQFRFLGGGVVVSIVTAVGNSWIKNALSKSLTPLQILAIFRSTEVINTLPASLQTVVREDFVESFNLQMRIVLGFSVAGVLTTLLMWQRVQVRVQ
ncbi:MAG: hypothetical protein M1818_004796 [Claussenomyces sp. TS43310]|nr:MAG: hypothetical protein M1818_004796 [Claussenomyces sp. TS43310]